MDEPDDDALRAEILARFPPGTLLAAELRRPAADPGWFAAARFPVPPGALLVRLVLRGPAAFDAPALEPVGRGAIPSAVYNAAVDGFVRDHALALHRLERDVLATLPEPVHLTVTYGGYRRTWDVWRLAPPVPTQTVRPGPPASPTVGRTPPAHRASSESAEPQWPLALAGLALVAALVRRRRRGRRGSAPP